MRWKKDSARADSRPAVTSLIEDVRLPEPQYLLHCGSVVWDLSIKTEPNSLLRQWIQLYAANSLSKYVFIWSKMKKWCRTVYTAGGWSGVKTLQRSFPQDFPSYAQCSIVIINSNSPLKYFVKRGGCLNEFLWGRMWKCGVCTLPVLSPLGHLIIL